MKFKGQFHGDCVDAFFVHFIPGNPVLRAGSESIGFAENKMNVKVVDLSTNPPTFLKGGRGGFSGMVFKIPLNPPFKKGDFKPPSIGQIKATFSGWGFFTLLRRHRQFNKKSVVLLRACARIT